MRVLSLILCVNWFYLNDCLNPRNIYRSKEMIVFYQYPNACVLNRIGSTIYDTYVWSRIKLQGAF
jgi:hypothetical protein